MYGYTPRLCCQSTRRALLATASSALLAGCLSNADDGPDSGNGSGGEGDGSGDKVPGLESDLRGIVEAQNRTAYASENGLELNNGTVLVVVELSDGARMPSGFGTRTRNRNDGMVETYVPVGDLIELAGHENVSLVRKPREPLPDDGVSRTTPEGE
jgi:hypothetical protein